MKNTSSWIGYKTISIIVVAILIIILSIIAYRNFVNSQEESLLPPLVIIENPDPGFLVGEPLSSEEESNLADLSRQMAEEANQASSTDESIEGTTTLEVDKTSFSIVVLNGSGVAGLATRAKAELEELGYQVSSTGNAESFDFSKSVLRYSEDEKQIAELIVGEWKGELELVIDETVTAPTLVLGKEYDE